MAIGPLVGNTLGGIVVCLFCLVFTVHKETRCLFWKPSTYKAKDLARTTGCGPSQECDPRGEPLPLLRRWQQEERVKSCLGFVKNFCLVCVMLGCGCFKYVFLDKTKDVRVMQIESNRSV